MRIVRRVRPGDLDAVHALALRAGYGLTTLTSDRALLAKRIAESCASFDRTGPASEGSSYLFVMEDLETGAIGGTCGIVSKVGILEPFYAYEVKSRLVESEALGVRKEIACLHLVEERNGPSEVGSLFLSKEFRGGGHGRFLSLARFLFLAEHRARFDPIILAEIRGVIDPQGRSPFWDAVGRNFFEVDFATADARSFSDKQFIAELLPRHPIYIPLLPPEARAVVGEVHEESRGARRILESEGFEYCGMVDIFEAGPVLQAHRDRIRTVAQSLRAPFLGIASVGAAPAAAPECLVAATGSEFRVVRTRVASSPEGVRIDSSAAAALGVVAGDRVRYAPF